MKRQLQNNFTTPEQSRRLLELGLPADSADCYWHFIRRTEHALLRTELCWLEPPYVDRYTAFVDMAVGYDKYRENRLKTYLPCWSVGRLIEIITICCNHYSGNNDIIFNQDAVNHGIIECLVAYLAIKKKDVSVDFSKLEE